jgi:protein-L-isoaspartate(D-aspartate) O-methyltransferase
MTQLAQLEPTESVLEIGTGSGYQTAILAQLAREVFTIEIVAPLAQRARERLTRLGLSERVHFRCGDGYAGWSEAAPFDAIVVTAAPPAIPPLLAEQLRIGGRMVIPVGGNLQELRVLEKTERGLEDQAVLPVRFVPMTGRALEELRVEL